MIVPSPFLFSRLKEALAPPCVQNLSKIYQQPNLMFLNILLIFTKKYIKMDVYVYISSDIIILAYTTFIYQPALLLLIWPFCFDNCMVSVTHF